MFFELLVFVFGLISGHILSQYLSVKLDWFTWVNKMFFYLLHHRFVKIANVVCCCCPFRYPSIPSFSDVEIGSMFRMIPYFIDNKHLWKMFTKLGKDSDFFTLINNYPFFGQFSNSTRKDEHKEQQQQQKQQHKHNELHSHHNNHPNHNEMPLLEQPVLPCTVPEPQTNSESEVKLPLDNTQHVEYHKPRRPVQRKILKKPSSHSLS